MATIKLGHTPEAKSRDLELSSPGPCGILQWVDLRDDHTMIYG